LPFKTTAKLLLKFYNTYHQKDKDEVFSISYEEKSQLQGFYHNFREIFFDEIEKFNNFLNFQVKICETELNLIKSKAISIKLSLNENQNDSINFKAIFHQFYLKLGYINEYYKTNELIFSHLQVKFNSLFVLFQDFLNDSSPQNKNSSLDSLKKTKAFHKLSKKPLIALRDLLQKARICYLKMYYTEFSRSKGDKKLKELFRQTQSKLISSRTLRSIYFFLGIALILLIIIILLIYTEGLDPDSDDQAKKIIFKYQFPIFRGFLFILLYLGLLAWNAYGWLKKQVNYHAIFGFFTHYSSPSEILQRVVFFSSVWLLTFLIFLVFLIFGNDSAVFGFFPIHYLGGINWLLLIGYLFFPDKTMCNGKGRGYLLKMFWKILSKSCWKVEFPMIFIINQFTSFVLALKDLEYTACFYISIWIHPEIKYPQNCMEDNFQIGFLVAFFPLLIRIIQCCRVAYDRKDKKLKRFDLINIGKFLTTAIVTILSLVLGKLKTAKSDSFDLFFYSWIITASISTLYSYFWDVKMGWGLCEKGYGLLKARMHFNKWIYYLAIVMDLIFRMTWILNISPDVINAVLWRPELSVFILGSMEMIRRTMWNFLRVDKETLSNTKLKKFIPDIIESLNEFSSKSNIEYIKKSEGKISLESNSSFLLEDLLKKEPLYSSNDISELNLIEKMEKIYESDEDEWQLVEEKIKGKELKMEKVENMKKAIKVFEKQIMEKSRNNTLIEKNSEME